jgi:hypothetical protein
MVNKMSKKVIGIIFVSLLLCVLIISMMVSYFLDINPPLLTDINKYNEYVDEIYNADAFMPSLDNLPDYASLEVYYDNGDSKSISLSITYDESSYESSKETILNWYSFLETPIEGNGYYKIPNNDFHLKTYHIQVVNNDDFSYPSNFGMIGYSDDYNTITFLFFYDRSRGQISYDMADFVDENFKFPIE